MKNLTLILFTFFGLTVSSQDFYIKNSTDTIKCSNLKHEIGSQQLLKKLNFTTESGISKEITNKTELEQVTTIFIAEQGYWDKIPIKPHAPNGITRFTNRVTFGKLAVYYEPQQYNTRMEPVGIYRYYILLPDGIYYKVYNKSNMKKIIKSFLLECAAFKSAYSGDFSSEVMPFIEMINLYNSVCE